MPELNPIRVLPKENVWNETNRLFSEYLNNRFSRSSVENAISILEAGCGVSWNLDLSFNYELTGVDLSEKAMKIRKERHNDIDHFIVGDLSSVEIDEGAFDIIYCAYVLEHLSGAEKVLDRFFRWLKPGGVAVLLFPDRASVFGFITRMTPHWFHVFYYKYVLKFPDAGVLGRPPFPTKYDQIVSRDAMHRYCSEHGYNVVLEFATPIAIPSKAGALKPLIAFAIKLLALASFGRLTDRHQNLALIIQKPASE